MGQSKGYKPKVDRSKGKQTASLVSRVKNRLQGNKPKEIKIGVERRIKHSKCLYCGTPLAVNVWKYCQDHTLAYTRNHKFLNDNKRRKKFLIELSKRKNLGRYLYKTYPFLKTQKGLIAEHIRYKIRTGL